jgi:hypothetical protein
LLLVVTEKMPLALQTSGSSNEDYEKHSHPSCGVGGHPTYRPKRAAT